MAEHIKVNELEIAGQLKDEDRLLVLTDDINNEVKTIAKPYVASGLISKLENNLITNDGGLYVDGNAFNELLEAVKLIKERQVDEIGRPIPTFSNTLLDDEIWLEGATVSRKEYAQLFEVYGETYGAGDGKTTFKLPDCRNRVFWGASNFGYLDATLPNAIGNITGVDSGGSSPGADGICKVTNSWTVHGRGTTNSTHANYQINLSEGNSIYQDNATVRPPSIKVRIKTRFK